MWAYNIKDTHFDKYDLWSGILVLTALGICSTTNRLKCYSPEQLVFFRDMILLIKHMLDWKLIRQQNQTQINKDNIRENNKRVDHDYKFGDKVMLDNNAAYKYETPYKGLFVIIQCRTNGRVTLQCVAIKNRYNIVEK